MKNLLTAIVLGIVLAGVSLAQTSSKAAEVKMVVVEFSPGSNVEMTAEAKRQLQTGLAAALAKSSKVDVADVRHTRDASQENLAAINGNSSTAAVKLGKKFDVKYVLTGTVTEYVPKDADGFGQVIFKTRLIEVATSKVVHTSETKQKSTGVMNTGSMVEMHSKTVMPAVKKAAAEILELSL